MNENKPESLPHEPNLTIDDLKQLSIRTSLLGDGMNVHLLKRDVQILMNITHNYIKHGWNESDRQEYYSLLDRVMSTIAHYEEQKLHSIQKQDNEEV